MIKYIIIESHTNQFVKFIEKDITLFTIDIQDALRLSYKEAEKFVKENQLKYYDWKILMAQM